MTENELEKSEMSTVEFVSENLRGRVSPPGRAASVSERIRLAARDLGWSYNRTKDLWYADPRVSVSGKELREFEIATGVEYGRKQINEIDQILARADALLDGPDADFHRPFVAAFRAFVSALSSPGAER